MKKILQTGLLLITIVFISNCDKFDSWLYCNDEVKKERVSPNGKFTATLSVRNCGATTRLNSAVDIRPSETKFSANDEGFAFSEKGIPDIDLIWIGENSIRIICDQCSDVMKSQIPNSKVISRKLVYNKVQVFY